MEFEIRSALEQDREQIHQHMNNFFFKDEPLSSNFGGLPDDDPLYEDLYNLVAESLKEPSHNVVIFDEGKLIGVALNELHEKNQPIKFTENTVRSKNFEHICNILEYVEKESNLFEKFPFCDKMLLLKMLSVDSSYRGKGLAKILINKSRYLFETNISLFYFLCMQGDLKLTVKK